MIEAPALGPRPLPPVCLAETRIGLFDFSGVTCTEPLSYVSGSLHRASIDSCREVTTDLDLYTQPDPIGNLGDADPVLPAPGLDSEVFSSLYSYTLGNPVNHTDPLGLLTFKGCSQEQQTQLTNAFNDYCKRIQDPGFSGCVCQNGGGESIPGGLAGLCKKANRTIRCKSNESGMCKGNCAWSVPFGWVIRICPGAWQPNCGPLGCTLMHEMTHQLGHPFEKWPTKVEKCLGCS